MKNPFEGSPYRGISGNEKLEIKKRELLHRFKDILAIIQTPDGINKLPDRGRDHDFGDYIWIYLKNGFVPEFPQELGVSPEAAEFVRQISPEDREIFLKHWIVVF